MNKCKNCTYWVKCLYQRYNNIIPKEVTEYRISYTSDFKPVVFVIKCNKYEKIKPFKGKIF